MQRVTGAELRPGSLGALLSTLDRRFWLAAALGTLIAFGFLGIPTAVIPNPLFVRMTPTEGYSILVWLVSAPLIGLLIATYVRPAAHPLGHAQAEGGASSVTLGGLAAYLAIGCPICNKIIVATLGVSGALTIFAPLQPLIGVSSVAVLGATLAWRLRARARRCARCVS